jgi:hypothetical protein
MPRTAAMIIRYSKAPWALITDITKPVYINLSGISCKPFYTNIC